MVMAPRPVAPEVKSSPKVSGTPVAGVGTPLVPVVREIEALERSETKRLRSTLSESTPLGVARQSALRPRAMRVLARGTLLSWKDCK